MGEDPLFICGGGLLNDTDDGGAKPRLLGRRVSRSGKASVSLFAGQCASRGFSGLAGKDFPLL
jgi:hypothetical protein